MRNLQGRLDLCSINTATLGHREPLARTIDRIARAGFGGIAPWRREVEDGNVRELARQIRSLGLKVSGYCRSTYIPASTTEQYAANIESNIAALHDAAELGAKCFVIVAGGVPEGSRDLIGAREQLSEGILRMLATAHDCGVPLALEPLHPMYAANRSVLNSLSQALELCEDVDPRNSGFLSVAVDVYHCWWDPNLQQSIDAAGQSGRICAFHVCDWLYETSDMLLDRGMMGDGVIDLRSIRADVEHAGYDGLVEVEVFSQNNWWKRDQDEVLALCAQRLQTVC
jgi:sugar phosphate isomerase/epimerase